MPVLGVTQSAYAGVEWKIGEERVEREEVKRGEKKLRKHKNRKRTADVRGREA